MNFTIKYLLIILTDLIFVSHIFCFPEQGRWMITLDQETQYADFPKTMYNQTSIYTQIHCSSTKSKTKLRVGWLLRHSPCLDEYTNITNVRSQSYSYQNDIFPKYLLTGALKPKEIVVTCNEKIPINLPVLIKVVRAKSNSSKLLSNVTTHNDDENSLVTKAWEDGAYFYIIGMVCETANCDFSANLTVWIKASYGYLSAAEWPLLIFYGIMCLLYVIFGIFWLILSACFWRDLLRVQFWIGAVIFLGMLEKAFFYAEYQSINSTGQSIKGAVIFAQMISCIKRSLARLLVMIVCIGYGIVKPRLGPALKKVVIIGLLYFLFALVEACTRVLRPRSKPTRVYLYTYIPLAIIDTVIVWWTFTYLVQTLRQLRVRRNVIKYNLYRHFSNILILVIVASLIFMVWMVYSFELQKCKMKNWRDLWVDEAFWHVLFSLILLVIIWLWRPSNNNQRYAYSPVLDDDGMDDEDVLMDNISSGDMKKLSKAKENGKAKGKERKSTAEDDLKWIEENIPASVAEQAYPLIDSEEEITTSNISGSKIE